METTSVVIGDGAESIRKAEEELAAFKRKIDDESTLKIVRLPSIADLPIPAYQTAGAAGIDLYAAETWTSPRKSHVAKIPTGLCVQIPSGYVGFVLGRSGRSSRGDWTATGTVDSDFTGEVHVIITNVNNNDLIIERGERIAQLVIVPVMRMNIVEVEKLDQTARGTKGFGSTGG